MDFCFFQGLGNQADKIVYPDVQQVFITSDAVGKLKNLKQKVVFC
jgi:hypothetical protein